MAIRLVEFPLPSPTKTNRVSKIISAPTGAVFLGIVPGSSPVLVARGDPQLPDVDRTLSAVRAGVSLLPEETAGTYIGSWNGYFTEEGQERWHLFDVTV